MDDRQPVPLVERTDAKLRYARLHLDELRQQPANGSDFDRSHQESFLFHLFGARDAFLAELNVYLGTDLPLENLTVGKLRKALCEQDRRSPELAWLRELEGEHDSWFARAKQMRDHSTHIQGVARAFYLGGENDRKVFLKDPRTGEEIETHVHDLFVEWLAKMEELIRALRSAAASRQESLGAPTP